MEQTLDVSMLEPCEPLNRTLAAIMELSEGDYLRVIHRREPHLLYPLLEKQGFSRLTVAGHSEAAFDIYIWRQQDTAAEAAVHSATHSARS
jgi:uncharacterized protein (DUF2249 family)